MVPKKKPTATPEGQDCRQLGEQATRRFVRLTRSKKSLVKPYLWVMNKNEPAVYMRKERTRYKTALAGLANVILLSNWYHLVKAGPKMAPDKIGVARFVRHRVEGKVVTSEETQP